MVRFLGWLIVAGLWSSTLPADEPATDLVGKRGDPSAFQFEGARTFKPQAIANALRYDPLFLVAARHDGPMDLLLGTVAKQVRDGYRNEGFADAHVTTAPTPDGSKLVVTVEEGGRSFEAEVVIEAPEVFPGELLREWLTTGQPPEGGFARTIKTAAGPQVQWFDADGKPKSLSSPLWTRGEPAPFAETAWAQLETRVEKGLQSLGWSYAKPRIEVRRHADDPKLADLVVKISNPGPRDTLGAIDVRGAYGHPSEMIETWLALSTGMVLDSRALTDVRRRLIDSGRFRKVHVTTGSTGKRGVRKLVITVEEYEPAPLLGEPLSPEEEVMLKFADWMQTSATISQEFNFSIQYEALDFECILAPQLGVWARLQSAGEEKHRKFCSEVYADREGTCLSLPLSRIKNCGASVGASALATTRIGASANRQPGEQGFAVLFGFGMTLTDKAEAPFRWLIFVEPAAAIGVVHQPDVQVRLDGEALKVTGKTWHLTVNARDGSLDEFGSTEEGLKFSSRFRPGSLAERKADFDRRTADFEDWHDAERPAASLCRCLVQSVEQLAAFRPLGKFAVRVADRVCRDAAFDGLDAALRTLESEGEFDIPRTETPGFNAMMYQLGFLVIDHITRRDDWFWQVGRDVMLQNNGQAGFAAPDLLRITKSPEFGPLGCLIIAKGLQFVSPRLSRPLAARGMGQLSLDDFRTDYRFLLRADTLLGQLTRAAAEEVRSMPNAEVTALIADTVPGAALQADVASCLRRWRQTGQRPLDEALPPLLDDLWFNGLRDLVAGGLKGFTGAR